MPHFCNVNFVTSLHETGSMPKRLVTCDRQGDSHLMVGLLTTNIVKENKTTARVKAFWVLFVASALSPTSPMSGRYGWLPETHQSQDTHIEFLFCVYCWSPWQDGLQLHNGLSVFSLQVLGLRTAQHGNSHSIPLQALCYPSEQCPMRKPLTPSQHFSYSQRTLNVGPTTTTPGSAEG